MSQRLQKRRPMHLRQKGKFSGNQYATMFTELSKQNKFLSFLLQENVFGGIKNETCKKQNK